MKTKFLQAHCVQRRSPSFRRFQAKNLMHLCHFQNFSQHMVLNGEVSVQKQCQCQCLPRRFCLWIGRGCPSNLAWHHQPTVWGYPLCQTQKHVEPAPRWILTSLVHQTPLLYDWIRAPSGYGYLIAADFPCSAISDTSSPKV